MAGEETSFRIEWRPRAGEDLRSIVRYIAHDNPLRALSFGQELRDKAQRLAQHPELGRPGRPGLPPGVRELVLHPNYILFYRLRSAEHVVEILRVKHAAQRMP